MKYVFDNLYYAANKHVFLRYLISRQNKQGKLILKIIKTSRLTYWPPILFLASLMNNRWYLIFIFTTKTTGHSLCKCADVNIRSFVKNPSYLSRKWQSRRIMSLRWSEVDTGVSTCYRRLHLSINTVILPHRSTIFATNLSVFFLSNYVRYDKLSYRGILSSRSYVRAYLKFAPQSVEGKISRYKIRSKSDSIHRTEVMRFKIVSILAYGRMPTKPGLIVGKIAHFINSFTMVDCCFIVVNFIIYNIIAKCFRPG